MTGRVRLAGALLLALLGGGGALLASGRSWQTVVASRPRPFADAVVHVSGRTLEPALAALGLVALAGAMAVLATRGLARRIVGALLAAVGLAIGWQAVSGLRAVSPARARSLIADARTAAGLDPSRPAQVSVHVTWPALVLVCALAVLLAGLAVAAWGHRWAALSGRYEAPETRADIERQRSQATLWNALDHGEDPTARTQP
jgi:uncharacterized membrane protein (TIGR02234 family)